MNKIESNLQKEGQIHLIFISFYKVIPESILAISLLKLLYKWYQRLNSNKQLNQKSNKMPTFLESHFKIQQLESYLSKNEYLSCECLPNYIDAEVFKALKTSQKIPKREIYPNLYHWYVLMRQFSDRTLDIWLKERSIRSKNNEIIQEVVQVINENNLDKILIVQDNPQKINSLQRSTSDSSFSFSMQEAIKSSNLKFSSAELPELQSMDVGLPKPSSHIIKKLSSQYETVTQYIMDIKVNCQSGINVIKKIFQNETVKLESIKALSNSEDFGKATEIRVFFLTLPNVCEDLKNKISKCIQVQKIQCKKLKRNQSL